MNQFLKVCLVALAWLIYGGGRVCPGRDLPVRAACRPEVDARRPGVRPMHLNDWSCCPWQRTVDYHGSGSI